MISVLFKAWINQIRKWCFHLGTCAHCMLLMLASVYCRIKNSLSKHHHPCNVCHKLDKFQTHFLHQRLIGLETVPYVDGLMEYRSKWNLRSFCWKYLGVNYWDEVVVFFTWLDLRASPSSELRHQKMFNDIQPFSMKPFPRLNPLCIFQMQAVLNIYFLGGRCVCWRIISILALIWMYCIPYICFRW